MTIHLQRSEAVHRWTSFLSWKTSFVFQNLPSTDFQDSCALFSNPSTISYNSPESSPSLNSFFSDHPVQNSLSSCCSIPTPSLKIAKRPVYTRQTSNWIMQNLLITDFVSATNKFLADNLPATANCRQLSDSDYFDIWTRVKDSPGRGRQIADTIGWQYT